MSIWLWFVCGFASPIDVFGFGAKNLARGNTGTGTRGMESLFLNPAEVFKESSLYCWVILFYETNFVDVPSVAWDSNQDGTINDLDTRFSQRLITPPLTG